MEYVFKTDDEAEARMVFASENMAHALWDISQMLRAKDKYGTEDSLSKESAIMEIREEFHRILGDRDIDLNEIIR